MAKLGRNNPCPCGSGQKYKRCCLKKQTNGEKIIAPAKKITVTEEVGILQRAAVNKEETMKIIGVFIFFSTATGDAWLLELTDLDAVIVAKSGEKIDTEIIENAETIEVNWTHRFKIKNKNFVTTAYANNEIETYDNYPTPTINSAIQKMQKIFSRQLLDSIHVTN